MVFGNYFLMMRLICLSVSLDRILFTDRIFYVLVVLVFTIPNFLAENLNVVAQLPIRSSDLVLRVFLVSRELRSSRAI